MELGAEAPNPKIQKVGKKQGKKVRKRLKQELAQLMMGSFVVVACLLLLPAQLAWPQMQLSTRADQQPPPPLTQRAKCGKDMRAWLSMPCVH